jgi:hypothetical protein
VLKLQIGHDGKGRGDGWHCDKVVAKCLDEENSAVTYSFPCNRWLDKEEEDGQLQVFLENSYFNVGYISCEMR